MSIPHPRAAAAVTVAALFVLAAVAGGQPAKTTETVGPNEQKSFQPGYAVGDIAVGNPGVADFKVMPGRRELLIFGRGEGQTTLTIWDQQRVKRHEILVSVRTPVDPQIARELKLLLQDFPSVEVQTLGGQLVLAGAVSSQDDLAAIDRIAAVAKVRSLVRYVAPALAAAASGAVPAATARPGAVPGPSIPVAGPDKPGVPPPPTVAVPHVEYEIELLEASSRFRSGSYATGVEPSGRRLYLGRIAAPFGADGEVFIGGKAVTGKDKTAKPGVEQGIRLTLRPNVPDSRGRFITGVLVQTNLPIGSDTYDPESWRRARWEFPASSGEPFGITGADLMATPDLSTGGSSALGTATRGASTVTRLPGVPSFPGTEIVPVFGSLFGSSSYKQKQSQLLVVIRPRIVSGGGY